MKLQPMTHEPGQHGPGCAIWCTARYEQDRAELDARAAEARQREVGKMGTDMDALMEHLREQGYRDETGQFRVQSWRKGMVRVQMEDPDAQYVTVYVFDPRHPRAQVLLWEATFAGAPVEVITGALKTAHDSVAAALIPEN